MRPLTESEKTKFIQNQQQVEVDFKNNFPDKEMAPFLYYVPESYMPFLMEDNKGIPPRINKDFPFIDDLLPLSDETYHQKYLIVVNGEKFIYDLPFKHKP